MQYIWEINDLQKSHGQSSLMKEQLKCKLIGKKRVEGKFVNEVKFIVKNVDFKIL